MVYDEEVLERAAVPGSFVFSVEAAHCFQESSGHEDFFVFLFHLHECVAELDHCLFVFYEEFVLGFADSEELV